MLLNEPFEWHAIKSIEDNELLILTRGLRGGNDYEADTFKIDEPILTQNFFYFFDKFLNMSNLQS